MNMKIFLILLFSLFVFPVFAQENNSTDNSLITSLVEQNLKVSELSSKNEVKIDGIEITLNDVEKRLQNEIIVVGTDLVDVEERLQNEIISLENNMNTTSYLIIGISGVIALISGYLGWRAHKNQFNQELSKLHFQHLKDAILPSFETFFGQLESWHEKGSIIQCPTYDDIITARSLDLWEINVNKTENSEYIGKLDVNLFQDLFTNHYPLLKQKLNMIVKNVESYHKIREEIISKISDFIISRVEEKFTIITSMEDIEENTEPGGVPKKSILVNEFAHELLMGKINDHSVSDFKVDRHIPAQAIAVSSPTTSSRTSRILYPQTTDDPKDDEFVNSVIETFYSLDIQKNEIIKLRNSFQIFRNSLDELKQNLREIEAKVILKTTKTLFTSNCRYIKEDL